MAYIHKRCIGTVARMWADTVSTQFTDSWDQMLLYSQQKLCGKDEYIYKLPGVPILGAGSSFHETGRNALVAQMEGPWLFQSDTDHQFAPDFLVRLLQYKEKQHSPVISGVYLQKQEPHVLVARLWDPQGNVVQVAGWDEGDEVVEVGMVGGGCLLVDRWVFDKIKAEMGQEPFDQVTDGTKYSEDFSFCWRCQKLGIPVHLAVNCEYHHLGPRGVLHAADHVKVRSK